MLQLQKKISPICVVADDSIFLTVAAAHLSVTSNVLSFLPGLREQGARYLQDVSVANGYSMDRVVVLNKKSQLSLLDTHKRKVHVIHDFDHEGVARLSYLYLFYESDLLLVLYCRLTCS